MRVFVRTGPFSAIRPLLGPCFAAALCCLPACERLKSPPRPPGVPADATRHESEWLGFWASVSPDGAVRLYHQDGALAYTGSARASRMGERVFYSKNGPWKSYSIDGRTVTSQGAYRDNWRDGTWEYFDHRGRLFMVIRYQPEPKTMFPLPTTEYGNENGPFERYFADGTLEIRGNYRAGLYEGPLTRYYRSGRPAMIGAYHQDRPEGAWKYYYPEGGLEREENYRNGQLDGPLRNYCPDGRPHQTTRYAAGIEVGPKSVTPCDARGP